MELFLHMTVLSAYSLLPSARHVHIWFAVRAYCVITTLLCLTAYRIAIYIHKRNSPPSYLQLEENFLFSNLKKYAAQAAL